MDITALYDIFKAHPVVTTDSRECPPGSIFFALKGESFDGNKFAKAALEKGCSYAVIDNPEYKTTAGGGISPDRFIVVDDCLHTLQQLARHHRRQFRGPVIGITGTNGKTTTKELVAAVLGEKYDVLFTQGNFNNDIGVPKTLLRLNETHDIAVIEMGASHPGDIRTLVEIAEPDSGIITNVGRAHLQGFGSLEGVIQTKGELYDYLRSKKDNHIFIDGGNDLLTGISDGLHLIKYGIEKNKNDIHGSENEGCPDSNGYAVVGRVTACAPCLSFDWHTNKGVLSSDKGETYHIDTHLIGSYNILNMLAAICIGLHYGVSPEQADRALTAYTPKNNRSQLETTPHNHLIVDTYNANPTSMEAAIANFKTMDVSPKMAILGDMRELGECSFEEHQRIADMLKGCDFQDIWLVGAEFGKTNIDRISTEEPSADVRKFSDVEAVKAEIARKRPENKYILIKGSNGIRLFELPELL